MKLIYLINIFDAIEKLDENIYSYLISTDIELKELMKTLSNEINENKKE